MPVIFKVCGKSKDLYYVCIVYKYAMEKNMCDVRNCMNWKNNKTKTLDSGVIVEYCLVHA